MAQTLLDETSFSGWGIRTVAATRSALQPDVVSQRLDLAARQRIDRAGICAYGLQHHALKILTGLFDASLFMDLRRMPELFCGFARRAGEGPTLYPVACSPQAWAAGSVFLLVQACLGLTIDAPRAQIRFFRPSLPESLQRLWIVESCVLESRRSICTSSGIRNDVGVSLMRREGNVEVLVVK